MKTTHGGLKISEADWNASAKHLEAALDKFKVDPKTKAEVMSFVGTLKKDIVEP
jgi:hemoglobin